MGPGSPDLVHVVTECAKLAFADREAYYGDPRMVEVPLADLLSPAYAAERRQLVGEGASVELRPGRPAGRVPRLPEARGGARRPAGTCWHCGTARDGDIEPSGT